MNGIENLALSAAYTRSQCISMVVPMPTAAPATAATTGLLQPSSARMNWNTGRSSVMAPSPTLFRKSSRSLPAVKISGLPVMRMARTLVSLSASRRASAMAVYMAPVMAFLRSGRLNSMVRMPLAVVVWMSIQVSVTVQP